MKGGMARTAAVWATAAVSAEASLVRVAITS